MSLNNKSLKELNSDLKDRFEPGFEQDLRSLPKERQLEVRKMSQEVDDELELIDRGFDEGEAIANKFRSAGYLPSQAEALLKESKNKEIGSVFKFFGKEYHDETKKLTYTTYDKFFVKTPFNTVVLADVYIDTLQNQCIQLGQMNEQFTNASFFGLIGLAFKRTYNNLVKGKNNG